MLTRERTERSHASRSKICGILALSVVFVAFVSNISGARGLEVPTTTEVSNVCDGDPNVCACYLREDGDFCTSCNFGQQSCADGECDTFCQNQRHVEQSCPRASVGHECIGLDSDACNSGECCICGYCETEESGFCPALASSDKYLVELLKQAEFKGICAFSKMMEKCYFGDLGSDPSYLNTYACMRTTPLNNGGEEGGMVLDVCPSASDYESCSLAYQSGGECQWMVDFCNPNACQYFGDEHATCTMYANNGTQSCACSAGYVAYQDDPVYAAFSSGGSTSYSVCVPENCIAGGFLAVFGGNETDVTSALTLLTIDHGEIPYYIAASNESYSSVLFSHFLGCGHLNQTHDILGCCETDTSCLDCSKCESFDLTDTFNGETGSGAWYSDNEWDALYDPQVPHIVAALNSGQVLTSDCDGSAVELYGFIDGTSCQVECALGLATHGIDTDLLCGYNDGLKTASTALQCTNYQCTCPNGTPVVDELCHDDGSVSCKLCDTGYALQRGGCVNINETFVAVNPNYLTTTHNMDVLFAEDLGECATACFKSFYCELFEYAGTSDGESSGGEVGVRRMLPGALNPCLLYNNSGCVPSETVQIEGRAECPCQPSTFEEAIPLNETCGIMGSNGRCYDLEYGSHGCRAYDDGDDRPWCYVDAATCNVSKSSTVLFPAQVGLYYSYATCNESVAATYCNDDMTAPTLCLIDGVEACSACDEGYVLVGERSCISDTMHDRYAVNNATKCIGQNLVALDVADELTRLQYGNTLSADECLQQCDECADCTRVARSIDGKTCELFSDASCGYHDIDTKSQLFSLYQRCVYWVNASDDNHVYTCKDTSPDDGCTSLLDLGGAEVPCDALEYYKYYNNPVRGFNLCENGYDTQCEPFQDASPCASVLNLGSEEMYCCQCGKCMAGDDCEVRSKVDSAKFDYCQQCMSYFARTGACFNVLAYDDTATYVYDCSLHVDPDRCTAMQSEYFSDVLFSSLPDSELKAATKCIGYCMPKQHGGLVPDGVDEDLAYFINDLYEYCVGCTNNATGVDTCSTCAPLPSPPLNASYVQGSALWTLPNIFDAVFDSVPMPSCVEGAQLTSLGRGTECKLECDTGLVPQGGDETAAYRCDPHSFGGVPQTSLVCVEAQCPPIDLSDYVHVVSVNSSNSCANGTVLTAIGSPSCEVACEEGVEMTGDGLIVCGPTGELELNIACVPSCAPLSFPLGVEGDDRNGRACYSGQRLNAQSDPSCDVYCNAGFYASSSDDPDETSSFQCVSIGAGVYGLTGSLECTEKTCAAIDSTGDVAVCNSSSVSAVWPLSSTLAPICLDGEENDGYVCACPPEGVGANVSNGPTTCERATCSPVVLPAGQDIVSGGIADEVACTDGLVLGRGESCAVQCDASRGLEHGQYGLVSCAADAPNGSEPVGSLSCVEAPCALPSLENGGDGTCSKVISSGGYCSPTCDSGYIQEPIDSLYVRCYRGNVTETVACASIPSEEIIEAVTPFSIPMDIVVPEDDETSGDVLVVDGEGSDGPACVLPSIDNATERGLKYTISLFAGCPSDEVSNVRFECDETVPTRRRLGDTNLRKVYLHFDIKVRTSDQAETIRDVLVEASQSTTNASAPFFQEYDSYAANNEDPTWSLPFSTDQDGDPVLGLENIVDKSLTVADLALLKYGFVNYTDPNSGQQLVLDAGANYCAKMHSGVLWLLSGFVATNSSVALEETCEQHNADPIVQISAVVDSETAETSSVVSDSTDSNSGENELLLTVGIVCGTILLGVMLVLMVYLRQRHFANLESEKHKHRVTMDQLARAEREELIDKHAKQLKSEGKDFMSIWRVPWKRVQIGDCIRDTGGLGPTLRAKYDFEGTGKEFMMAACIVKGIPPAEKMTAASSKPATMRLLRPPSSMGDGADEHWNAVLDLENTLRAASDKGSKTQNVEDEVDIDVLHKLHRVSRSHGFVYVFGLAHNPNPRPIRGCRWFLISESLEGGSIDEAAWSPAENVHWFERVLWLVDIVGALKHLHLSGLAHGNLKSANCMLYRSASCSDSRLSKSSKMERHVAQWARGSFRRVRLTDLSIIGDILKPMKKTSEETSEIVEAYRAHLGRARSESDCNDELVDFIESRIEVLENTSVDDGKSPTKLNVASLRAPPSADVFDDKLPESADQGLKFWLARSKQHIDVNADILEEDDNELLGDRKRTKVRKKRRAATGEDLKSSKAAMAVVNRFKSLYSVMQWNAWQAPEIVLTSGRKKMRQATSSHTDMYSFGIIMGELMSLRKPFNNFSWHSTKENLLAGKKERNAREDLIKAVLTGRRPAVVETGGRAPRGYADLMHQCWRQRPDGRPSSARVFRRVDKIRLSMEETIRKRYAHLVQSGYDESGEDESSNFFGRVLKSISSRSTMPKSDGLELMPTTKFSTGLSMSETGGHESGNETVNGTKLATFSTGNNNLSMDILGADTPMVPSRHSLETKTHFAAVRDDSDEHFEGPRRDVPIVTASFNELPPGIPTMTKSEHDLAVLAGRAAMKKVDDGIAIEMGSV
eukprot:g1264.t1